MIYMSSIMKLRLDSFIRPGKAFADCERGTARTGI